MLHFVHWLHVDKVLWTILPKFPVVFTEKLLVQQRKKLLFGNGKAIRGNQNIVHCLSKKKAILLLKHQLKIQLHSNINVVPPDGSIPDGCSANSKRIVPPTNVMSVLAHRGSDDILCTVNEWSVSGDNDWEDLNVVDGEELCQLLNKCYGTITQISCC